MDAEMFHAEVIAHLSEIQDILRDRLPGRGADEPWLDSADRAFRSVAEMLGITLLDESAPGAVVRDEIARLREEVERVRDLKAHYHKVIDLRNARCLDLVRERDAARAALEAAPDRDDIADPEYDAWWDKRRAAALAGTPEEEPCEPAEGGAS